MIKNNKRKLVLSSLLILLPILAGILLWNQLPDRIATHWGLDGNPDGWSSRPLAVFGSPLFFLAMHWLGVFVTAKDPKNKGQNRKVMGLVLWICPIISIVANSIVYTTVLGIAVPVGTVALLLVGLGFVFIGNYLPKCKQNYTIGIKITWTLASEENWNATHRLAGKLWIIGGLLMMAGAFLPQGALPYMLLGLLSIVVIIPVVYSYLFYKKNG